MANKIIDIQLSIPGAAAQPVVTGDRRLTLINLARVIRSALGAGLQSRLSGASSYLQVQTSVVCASATATCLGVQTGDKVTLNGTDITAAQKRATGTVTAASVQAGDTFTINGQIFTAVSGTVTLGEATFDCSGSDSACATSIAAQVNGYGGSLVNGIVGARSASAVATFYAITQGTAGNSITLTSSDAGRLLTSGTALANGAAVANNAFDFAGTDTTTAAALAYAINNSTTANVKLFSASSSLGVMTVSAKIGGTGGNAYTWTSSDGTRLAVTGSGFLADGAASAVTRWTL